MAFELMKEMSWTWTDYEATPVYVRQFCWDFIMRKRRVQNARIEDQRRSDERGGAGVTRIKY